MALVLTIDLRGAIAFSSFGVLVYYAIANTAALTQTQRRYPRALQVVGLIGCLGLVVTLPPLGIAAGVVVLAVGVLLRLLTRRILRRLDAGSVDRAAEPPVA